MGAPPPTAGVSSFCKGRTGNVFHSVGHAVSVADIQLCLYGAKGVTGGNVDECDTAVFQKSFIYKGRQ